MRSRLVLAGAIALVLALAAASGAAAYRRARFPLRTFHVEAGNAGGVAIDLLDGAQALVAYRWDFASSTAKRELRSLETGTLVRVLAEGEHVGWIDLPERTVEWTRTLATPVSGLEVIDARTGSHVGTVPFLAARGYMLHQVNPAGEVVAVLTSAATVEAWDTRAQRRLRSFPEPREFVGGECSLFLSPRGDRVALERIGHQKRAVWSIATGEGWRETGGFLVGFSAEGETITIAGDHASVEATARGRGRTVAKTAGAHNATVSSSGELVAVWEGPEEGFAVRVLRVRTGELEREVRRAPGKGPFTLALSDSGRLGIASVDGAVDVWESR